MVAMEEDVLGPLQTPLHIFGAFSNLGQGPNCESHAHDDVVTPTRNSNNIS